MTIPTTTPKTVTVDGQRLSIARIIAAVEANRRTATEDWSGTAAVDAPIESDDVWGYLVDLLGRREFGRAYDRATSRLDSWTCDGRVGHYQITLHRRPHDRRNGNTHTIQNVWLTWDVDELNAAAAACNATRTTPSVSSAD